MPRVKAFVIDSSSTVRDTKLLYARVRRESDRMVDNAEFRFGTNSIVKEGDEINYIQDIVDTQSLRGIWNFQYSSRDEAGYNLDGNDGTFTADFGHVNVNFSKASSQFRDLYAVRFNAAGEEITITDATIGTKLDFTGSFDVYLWIDADTSHFDAGATEQIVFSKYDSGAGGHGLEIGGKKVAGSWRGFVRVRQTGTTSTITGTTELFVGSLPKLIRVSRDSNGDVRLYINEVEDGTSVNVSGTLANTQNLLFGTNSGGTEDYSGLIHQIRVYVGEVLSSDDSHKIYVAKPQPLTMKFAGTVWKIEDNTDEKRVFCRGLGDVLMRTSINKEILDGLGSDNLFESKNAGEIITEIMGEVDSSWLVADTASGSNITTYVAEGTLQRNIELLVLFDQDLFWTTPRKVLIKEPPRKTRLEFDNTRFGIISDGKDDTMTVNDLVLYGKNLLYSQEESFTATSGQTVFTLSDFPLNIRVYDNNVFQDPQGAAGVSYSVDFENKQVTFDTGRTLNNTIRFEYDYEDPSAISKRKTDSTSITNNGRYSRRLYVPQYRFINDLNTIANNLVTGETGRSSINQRIRVEIPGLADYIREIWQVAVTDNIKNLTFDQDSGDNERLKIKSIEWKFPEGVTIMECGEHMFDDFEMEKVKVESIAGISSNLIQSKQVASSVAT